MSSRFIITDYERSHRRHVLDLAFHAQRYFTHLDWEDVSDWLQTPGIVLKLVWKHNRLMGVLGTSVPLNGTVWLRLALVADNAAGKDVMPLLWEATCKELQQQQVTLAAALIINDWLVTYLPQLKFGYELDIITLSRQANHSPERTPPPVTIRTATTDDLPDLTRVDQTAFSAPWQMTEQEIRQAFRLASSATVALNGSDEIIGYQLSTLYNQSAHLARLAVLPNTQGKGVGAALVDNLIRGFLRRNINLITVNTQSDNVRSQRLYQAYDFQRNGYDLAVWMANL